MKLLTFVLASIFMVGCASEPATTEAQKAQSPTAEALESKVEQIDVEEHYPSGVLKMKGLSKDGKRQGLWQSYFKNGYKWSEVEYQDGIKDGDVVVFYQNGMMRYQGRYNDDDRSGIWTFYDTLGVVVKRVDMDEVRMNPDSLLNN